MAIVLQASLAGAALAVDGPAASAPATEVILPLLPPGTTTSEVDLPLFPPPASPGEKPSTTTDTAPESSGGLSPSASASTERAAPEPTAADESAVADTPPANPAKVDAPAAADAKPANQPKVEAPAVVDVQPADPPKVETTSAPDATPPADTPVDGAEPQVDATAASSDAAASPPTADVPPTPSDPVVAALVAKLADPEFRKSADTGDLETLAPFYGEQADAPLWVSIAGYTSKAHAVRAEIEAADNWGLKAGAFDLPPHSLPSTTDAQATSEAKLSLAVLQYARLAQGGRLFPSKASHLFDQRPEVRDPKSVLSDLVAAGDPAAYLRALNPQHEQFLRLQQALVKARAAAEQKGKKADSDRDVQLIVVNMQRWRWMPRELGAYHVWNNVPEFNARVVKGGKAIYTEKTIVGQFKYATPFFSAPMTSIVFHPEWTVPSTILREDLAPSLQSSLGFFGNANTSILRQHNLRVSYKGQPVNADSVDWRNVNIRQYTFTQPPGPDNVLGQLKFNFPNRHAIYMHDTPQRELFAEPIRTLSHGCIRVREPDRLAALLLAEDKGWPAGQVKSMLARNASSVVKLNRPVPVHLTYFTAVVDEQGRLSTYADIYGIDNRMAPAMFDNPVKFNVPATPMVVEASRRRPDDWRSGQQTGGMADLISGLFGN
ncbi:MAG: L,D-transpeptidase family protein [Methyloceanibacter sp.]